jgi:CRISPR-associated protein Csb2
MPTLLLRFPGRRYHATPWGHHVNEGMIEWPPSPWRLLRALLATGYAKLSWPAEGPPAVARSLIEKLSGVLPTYRLPEVVGTHSRHYMPLARFKNGREETTLVFDTWAQVDDGELAVRWDVDLSGDESTLLAELARELGYLGRSESWVEGELLRDDPDDPGFEVHPGEMKDRPGPGWEQVPLLSAVSSDDYAAWRSEAVRQAVESIPPNSPKGKPLSAAQRRAAVAKVEAAHPVDILDCLQIETGRLHELGWSQPPGTRKVLYWRLSHALEGAAPRSKPRPTKAAPLECMLLAMATASGNQHALPSLTRVLPQAELLHRALNAHASRIAGHSVVLSGCDADRKPLTTPHRHAHLFHLDLDDDNCLDHVLIWAPMGLDTAAQAAVRSVRRTFTKGGTTPLRIALAASGSLTELVALPAPLGDGLRALLGGTNLRARQWRSLTPFVPPRHLKKNGRNTLSSQVAAELEVRGMPAPDSVTLLNPQNDECARLARHFVRRRRSGPPPPVDCGFMLDLTFAEAVPGPLALGYGSHYGLGVFASHSGELRDSMPASRFGQ